MKSAATTARARFSAHCGATYEIERSSQDLISHVLLSRHVAGDRAARDVAPHLGQELQRVVVARKGELLVGERRRYHAPPVDERLLELVDLRLREDHLSPPLHPVVGHV